MAKKSVVLGIPLTLLLRAGNTLGINISGRVSKAIAAANVVSPWIGETVKSASGSLEAGVGQNILSGIGNVFSAFTALVDMNAQVVTVSEKRRLAIVSIPGRESDFLQDLGGHSVMYRISGKFFDNDPSYNQNLPIIQNTLQTLIRNGATGSTQLIRLLMRSAVPVPFMCEHEIAMTVITSFDFSMIGGEPSWVNYDMKLVEYTRIPYVAKMALLGTSNYFGGG